MNVIRTYKHIKTNSYIHRILYIRQLNHMVVYLDLDIIHTDKLISQNRDTDIIKTHIRQGISHTDV